MHAKKEEKKRKTEFWWATFTVIWRSSKITAIFLADDFWRAVRTSRATFCSYHIFTSFVVYKWTEVRQHAVYLLILSRGRFNYSLLTLY